MAVDSITEGVVSPVVRTSTDGGVPVNADPRDDSGQTNPPVDSIAGTADDSIVREFGHDGFDPVGTLVLVLIYMAILIGMWVFMYFVGFFGRGLTVVG